MKKLIFALAILSLLSVSAFAAIMEQYKTPFEFPRRYGVERLTHYDPRVSITKIDNTVYLEPAFLEASVGVGRGGYQPIFPRGIARVQSSEWDGYPRGSVTITTKDIPISDRVNAQFEAWLVDDDSGYRLSLGTFPTLFGGVGELRYNGPLYFNAYDRVEVTIEPFDDLDPLPGTLMLEGPIQQFPKQPFQPPAKQSKMVTETFTFI